MRRADRLFQIIQWLRGRRRAVTAAWLAEQLQVSERTVYRDIRDLMASGTPIEGEAGVGYRLSRDYDLPPLMFEPAELEALVLGARLAAAIGDDSLVRPARSALSKVEAALPPHLRSRLSRPPLFAPRTFASRAGSTTLLSIRSAMGEKRKLRLRYRNEKEEESERVVRPLGAFYWGKIWTLAAWCELRNDFRNFRLDRIAELTPIEERFEDEPGRRLRDYLRQIGDFAERLLDE